MRLITLLTFLLFSCTEEIEIVPDLSPAPRLLQRVEQNIYKGEQPTVFELKESFHYDDQNRVEEILSYEAGGVIKWVFSYGDSHKPNSMQIYRDEALVQEGELYYDDHQLDFVITRSAVTGRELFRDEFSYDNEGKMMQHLRVSDYVTGRQDFTWEEGNVSGVTEGFRGLGLQHRYTYDQMQNPYWTVFANIGFDLVHHVALSRNNPLSEYSTRIYDDTDMGSVTISYAYQKPGLPYYSYQIIRDYHAREEILTLRYSYLPVITR